VPSTSNRVETNRMGSFQTVTFSQELSYLFSKNEFPFVCVNNVLTLFNLGKSVTYTEKIY